MSDWETIGYRVEWDHLAEHGWPCRRVVRERKQVIKKSPEKVLKLLRKISETDTRVPGPALNITVTELQTRIETREKPCGLAGWEK